MAQLKRAQCCCLLAVLLAKTSDGFLVPQPAEVTPSWIPKSKPNDAAVREDLLVCKMAPDDCDRPRKRDVFKRDMYVEHKDKNFWEKEN
jgi:hypothetical protein